MVEKPLIYFKHHSEWRSWLQENHANFDGVYLVFYKVASEEESMRWEEAVKVALDLLKGNEFQLKPEPAAPIRWKRPDGFIVK